jgi:hypothetical protein
MELVVATLWAYVHNLVFNGVVQSDGDNLPPKGQFVPIKENSITLN